MANLKSEVTAFEAKTHLSELLRETERGRSFVIKRRGKAVARLIPAERKRSASDWKKLMDSIRERRERIEKRTGKIDVRGLIEEGRRF